MAPKKPNFMEESSSYEDPEKPCLLLHNKPKNQLKTKSFRDKEESR